MNVLILLPVLLPMFLGCLLLLPLPRPVLRGLFVLGVVAQVPIAIALLQMASGGELFFYALGGWEAPFGIALMVDRLSAVMVSVVAVLSTCAAIYAVRGHDEIGRFFHSIFAFQLMGLNGAFLTGDLFNLFVFFEILLIASYGLLMHGAGAERTRAGTHYVLINLIGSTVFLAGLGVIYGAAGTLNMVDISIQVANASPDEQRIFTIGAMLLLAIFGLKAAMMPLIPWLPKAYAAASAPVAAIFVIMTKVGVYAIIRVFILVFGLSAGSLDGIVSVWLWPLSLLTITFGAMGVLSSTDFKETLGYLVVVSAGTLQATVALDTPAMVGAGLFYLAHTTAAAGAMFLLADLIGRERGEKRTRLVSGPPLRHPRLLGGLFFIAAVTIAGLPPFSGFFGKVGILLATPPGTPQIALWGVLLVSGLVSIIALSRAGSTLIWRTKDAAPTMVPMDRVRVAATIGLIAVSPLMVIFAQPIIEYLNAAAAQLFEVELYHAVIQTHGGER